MKAQLHLKVYPNEPPRLIEFEIPKSGVVKVCDGVHILTGKHILPSAVCAPKDKPEQRTRD